MSRYSRHIILPEIGKKGQDKLANAKVLVIGAGGLGCPVLQYLAAAGIGTIGIVDFDVVDESNLQRQILFGTTTLGKNKALAAKERLTDINPQVAIITYPEALTHKNAITIFEQYDIVVDGTDNFDTRYLINDAAIITHKPLVYGAIYKFEGQVAVFNYKNGPSYRCLFPTPPKKGSLPNCSEVGVLGVLPGIIGTLQANEVLKITLEIGTVLSGKIHYYNALTTQSYTLNLDRNQSAIDLVLKKKHTFSKQEDASFVCDNAIKEITIQEGLRLENTLFIDIREASELPKINQLPHIQIPVRELENRISVIKTNQIIIIFCQSGIRSKKAIQILQQNNIHDCYSLIGGALAIEKHYKLKLTTEKTSQK